MWRMKRGISTLRNSFCETFRKGLEQVYIFRKPRNYKNRRSKFQLCLLIDISYIPAGRDISYIPAGRIRLHTLIDLTPHFQSRTLI